MTKVAMETNESPESPPKPFKCPSCPKYYAYGPSLKQHILKQHEESEIVKCYRCEKCLKNIQNTKSLFATQKLLNEHMRRMHSPARYKCQVCFKTTTSVSDLHRHEQIHLQKLDAGHKCDLCSTSFKSGRNLHLHLFTVHKIKTEGVKYFKCELCSLEFVSGCKLETHVVGEHVVDKSYECRVCSKTFIDQAAVEEHMKKRHERQTKYLCDICSKGYTERKNLICHLKVEHLKFLYCDKCLRSFSNKSEFEQHLDLKTSSEFKLKTICQICDESFHSQCHLDTHTNSHLNQLNPKVNEIEANKNKNVAAVSEIGDNLLDSPELITSKASSLISFEEFKCQVCSTMFECGGHLKSHLKVVHSNVTWNCDFEQCSKSFKKYHQLKLHKMTHAETKSYVCNICEKAFYRPDVLKGHQETHADKKYICETCHKSFARPRALRDHVAHHHGGPKPKPFKC